MSSIINMRKTQEAKEVEYDNSNRPIRNWTQRDVTLLQELVEGIYSFRKIREAFEDRPFLAILKRWARCQGMIGIISERCREAMTAGMNMADLQHLPVDHLRCLTEDWSWKADQRLYEAICNGINWPELELRFAGAFGPAFDQNADYDQKKCAKYVYSMGSIYRTKERHIAEKKPLETAHRMNINLKRTDMKMSTDKFRMSLNRLNALAICLARDGEDETAVYHVSLSHKPDGGMVWKLILAKKRETTAEDTHYQSEFCARLKDINSGAVDHLKELFLEYRRDDILTRIGQIADMFDCENMQKTEVGSQRFIRLACDTPDVVMAEYMKLEEFCEGHVEKYNSEDDFGASHATKVLDNWLFATAHADQLDVNELHNLMWMAEALASECDLDVLVPGQSAHIRQLANLYRAVGMVHEHYHNEFAASKRAIDVVLTEVSSPTLSMTVEQKSSIAILRERINKLESRGRAAPKTLGFHKPRSEDFETSIRLCQHPAITLALHVLNDQMRSEAPYLCLGLSQGLCKLCVSAIERINRDVHRQILYRARVDKRHPWDWLLPVHVPEKCRRHMVHCVEDAVDAIFVAKKKTRDCDGAKSRR